MKTIKCFDRITRVTEYLAFQSQAHELNMACKPTCLDCTIMYGFHRETEKAWCFDLGEDWPRWGSRRYIWAPKSACASHHSIGVECGPVDVPGGGGGIGSGLSLRVGPLYA